MTKKRWIATVVAICMVVLLFQYIPVLHASAATEGSIKSGVTGVYFRETPGGTPIKDSNLFKWWTGTDDSGYIQFQLV